MSKTICKFKSISGGLVALMLTSTIAATPVSAKTLDLITGNASKNTAVGELEKIAAEIKDRTKGDVDIRIHLAGSLQIQTSDMAMAVSDDIVQIGDDQQFASAVPLAGILRLPALIRTREEFDKSAAILQPYINAEYAKNGLTVIGTYYYPPLEIFSAHKKIDKLEDMKNMKIRTLSAESSAWVEKVTGGAPITLSFADLAPGLDNGTIDAMTTTASGAGYPLRDQIKYNYRIPIAFSQVYEIINDDALNSLSAESQKVVKDVFADHLTKLSDEIATADVDLLKKMQEGGMASVTASEKELAHSQQVMQPYWEQWAKERGPEAEEALKKVRQALGR